MATIILKATRANTSLKAQSRAGELRDITYSDGSRLMINATDALLVNATDSFLVGSTTTIDAQILASSKSPVILIAKERE